MVKIKKLKQHREVTKDELTQASANGGEYPIEGFEMQCVLLHPVKVGAPILGTNSLTNEYIRTSIVLGVMAPNTDFDKLVIPKEFLGDAISLDWGEAREANQIAITKNSVYAIFNMPEDLKNG